VLKPNTSRLLWQGKAEPETVGTNSEALGLRMAEGLSLLSFEKLLQLIAVKAHDDLSVNHGDWCRHVTKLLQLVNAVSSAAMFRSTNSMLFCVRNSFTFPQNIQPG
jgi:hypothetical protein